MFKDMKNWPDGKKKNFSVMAAIVITIAIAAGWFFVKSQISYFNESSPADNRGLENIKQSISDFSEKLNESKDEFFGTSTASSTDLMESTDTATSATSTK